MNHGWLVSRNIYNLGETIKSVDHIGIVIFEDNQEKAARQRAEELKCHVYRVTYDHMSGGGFVREVTISTSIERKENNMKEYFFITKNTYSDGTTLDDQQYVITSHTPNVLTDDRRAYVCEAEGLTRVNDGFFYLASKIKIIRQWEGEFDVNHLLIHNNKRDYIDRFADSITNGDLLQALLRLRTDELLETLRGYRNTFHKYYKWFIEQVMSKEYDIWKMRRRIHFILDCRGD